ncbi:hypothetical protein YTPLAS18_31920 [Nitrospira sp.]|nr:hypothetical protein YTPLAS18_31920 [Nitrospira sp.]
MAGSGTAAWGSRGFVRVLTHITEEVAALNEGAFTPFTELLVFRAFALPSGAYGGVLLLELLASYF